METTGTYAGKKIVKAHLNVPLMYFIIERS